MSIKVMFSIASCVAMMLSGCASTSTPMATYMPEASIQGLVEDRSHYPAILFRRPGSPDIGSYSRYIVGEVSIRVADSDVGKISEKDLAFMGDYLRVAIRHELGKAGYSVGPGHGDSVLKMEFVLSGFELLGAGSYKGIQTDGDRSDGAWISSMRVSSVIVEGVFIDAKDNRIDAIAVNKTKPQGFEDARWWSTWEDVESALDDWAIGIRKAVDRTRTSSSFPN